MRRYLLTVNRYDGRGELHRVVYSRREQSELFDRLCAVFRGPYSANLFAF